VQLGLHALGIGAGARREVIDSVAVSAEKAGFGTLWIGEHVAMVDHSASRYPYASDGRIAVPADADWLDPLIALSFVAAITSTIRVATGVLLVPEHNPVALAKSAASLDRLSRGRLALGIGVGWSQEEFAALGVPFERRGARTDEYLVALRTLWSEDPASFTGEFVNFTDIRLNPKPARHGRIPIIVGGNSDAALRRAARSGDGWYGFYLTDIAHTGERIARLHTLCEAAGRDPRELEIAVALDHEPSPEEHRDLARLGVDELVLVAAPPADTAQTDGWLKALQGPLASPV
jgi:probable F420-dependent oxidoreductase